ncbi:hypothetical protein J4H86_00795 [Spiractinospora alimapuensis]|uniref:hypothetical protein n=1 Tax=Spiractinospora alimapuensis TaxID=2820884 RepID=UPI001F1AA350|nr:hypothetical protein [Spiractinospora alimapuensis]QVQ52434.1 hypothetical protein J4H86_00795 [Spiractinospora alimapuensis]
MSGRATPFYCPYCGDEDLRPHEGDGRTGAGYAWLCGSCVRVFRVSFVGLSAADLNGVTESHDHRTEESR